MSVQTQIDRISGAVSDALAALVEKGVTVPDGTKVDGLAALIEAIESGGGVGKISVGTFTPDEPDTILYFEHDLGATPKYMAVWIDEKPSSTVMKELYGGFKRFNGIYSNPTVYVYASNTTGGGTGNLIKNYSITGSFTPDGDTVDGLPSGYNFLQLPANRKFFSIYAQTESLTNYGGFVVGRTYNWLLCA